MPHTYGWRADTHDPRDLRFSLVANDLGLLDLPRSVDLRPLCSPVADQTSLGSCTAQALVKGFRESLLVQAGQPVALSALFLYWYERFLERTVNDDAGAMIRDGMRVLRKLGVPPEREWPYDVARFKDHPPQPAVADAASYRISSYHRINNTIEIKQALVLNQPVVIGIAVFESFESSHVALTGVVPLPNQDVEKYLGGHAVMVCGYCDDDQTFLVRNSWGPDWGWKGYFTLPYGFFRPQLRLVSDMWTGTT